MQALLALNCPGHVSSCWGAARACMSSHSSWPQYLICQANTCPSPCPAARCSRGWRVKSLQTPAGWSPRSCCVCSNSGSKHVHAIHAHHKTTPSEHGKQTTQLLVDMLAPALLYGNTAHDHHVNKQSMVDALDVLSVQMVLILVLANGAPEPNFLLINLRRGRRRCNCRDTCNVQKVRGQAANAAGNPGSNLRASCAAALHDNRKPKNAAPLTVLTQVLGQTQCAAFSHVKIKGVL